MTTLDDYRWLVSPAAQPWLSRAALGLAGGETVLALASQLRGELTPTQAHLVLEQVELRERGREKFAAAGSMFFTRQGLEQATDELVAAYKASRFPAGGPVADLCCGIGGDLQALAARGPTVGIDRDPIAAIVAAANCRGLSGVKIEQTEVAQTTLANFAAWHIDPDRRPAGRRTTRVELHEPGPEIIAQLLAQCGNAAIKLAPAATFEEPWWHEAELEWIGRARQCRQLVVWFGNLAQQAGCHRATVLRGHLGQAPQLAASFVGEPNVETVLAPKIGRYLFVPDAAVRAAKLEGALAAEQQLQVVAHGVAYFTGDVLIDHGALTAFEVLDVHPYRPATLRAWLAARKLGRLEVKKRGVELDPEKVRRELHVAGDEAAVILLSRIAGQITAIVAKRVNTIP